MVAFVERVVRLVAEALELVGVRQHLARRGELVVFPGLRRDAIDLGELEREELGARRALALAGGQRARAPPCARCQPV